jgi:polyphosphate kinase
VWDEAARHRLRDEILTAYLADNVKARILRPDGEYIRAGKSGISFAAQEFLMQLACGTVTSMPHGLHAKV